MCGLCGMFDERPPLARCGGDARSGAFRRERLRRVAHRARRCSRPRASRVDDWEGASFLLRGPTGATEIVDNLFDLWRKAEALSGRRLDPLAD